MKTKLSRSVALVVLAAASPSWCLAAGSLKITAVNKLPLARDAQTIELSAKDLAPLSQTNSAQTDSAQTDSAQTDLMKIQVTDAAGKKLLAQAVDTDYDELRRPDILIFQADFKAGETKTFTVTVGEKHKYTKADVKAHGRFVRERFDDFTWENDRIAHRTYGKALETWKGEPLTSSTIDVWSKRTPRMVIDEWYMVDDYHADHGDGADFYSAGPSRGCGGNGIWAADKLWVSSNFVESRVLANGPIRVLFELVYDGFDANGTKVSERKRITLDAGSQFDHFQSFYQPQSTAASPLTTGIGLKKVKGEVEQFNAEHGWLAKWEPVEKNAGQQGLAVIVDPKQLVGRGEDQRNLLVLARAPGNVAAYWAGFAWDKAGRYTTFAAWKAHVDEFSQRVRSPMEISISAQQ